MPVLLLKKSIIETMSVLLLKKSIIEKMPVLLFKKINNREDVCSAGKKINDREDACSAVKIMVTHDKILQKKSAVVMKADASCHKLVIPWHFNTMYSKVPRFL